MMSKIILALTISLFFFQTGIAQEEKLSEYSFIVIPKKFDFQFSEDQYQLNSLLKFLFNKHGFHAFFDEELPDVKRCDGLRAEVTGSPGFIWTKVEIAIKNCEGEVVYKSVEGKSKLKEYDKTYNEALRRAFESIEVLGVQQKEIKLLKDYEEMIDNPNNKDNQQETIEDNPFNLPTARYTNFTEGSNSFLLRKTNEGYSLYKETSETLDGLVYEGKLFVVEGVLFFENENGEHFLANFDASGNFTIERESLKRVFVKNR